MKIAIQSSKPAVLQNHLRSAEANLCRLGGWRRPAAALLNAAAGERASMPARPAPTSRHAFTLLEVLLALIVLSMVMVVVHSVFQSALQLRNKADAAFTEAIPLQHTLAVIERDLANLTVPGGTLTGTLQTSLTTGSSTSSSHAGQQCGPAFYTASGALDENQPWSEMRKVTYYLMPATNDGAGLDLIRSVTRNLLPVLQEEYTDQRLMGGVYSLTFQFYNGSQWVDTWDSAASITTSSSTTTSSNSLPAGIRAQLTLVTDDRGSISQSPIELVVPVVVQGVTNSASGGAE